MACPLESCKTLPIGGDPRMLYSINNTPLTLLYPVSLTPSHGTGPPQTLLEGTGTDSRKAMVVGGWVRRG